MSKLRGPLLSLGASGTLGDTVTYASWHGIKYAKSKSIPSNPNSGDQQTQRGYFTSVVEMFHDTDLDADDKLAWSRRARRVAKSMSGFNLFTKIYVEALVAGQDTVMLTGMKANWSAASKKVTITGTCSENSFDLKANFYNEFGVLVGSGSLSSDEAGDVDTEVDYAMLSAPTLCMVESATVGTTGSTGYLLVTVGA